MGAEPRHSGHSQAGPGEKARVYLLFPDAGSAASGARREAAPETEEGQLVRRPGPRLDGHVPRSGAPTRSPVPPCPCGSTFQRGLGRGPAPWAL